MCCHINSKDFLVFVAVSQLTWLFLHMKANGSEPISLLTRSDSIV